MEPEDTLRQAVAARGPLSVARAAALGRQIAEAVARLHATEVTAGSALDPETVRIGFDADGHATAAIPRGAAAPGGPADPAEDVRGLGALLYELLTGAPPPRAGTPSPIQRVRSDVPESLAWLVMQCFAPTAAARPRSAAEIARRLAPFETGQGMGLDEPAPSLHTSGIPSGVPMAPPPDPRFEAGERTERLAPDGSLTARISSLSVPSLPVPAPAEPAEIPRPSGKILAGPLAPEPPPVPAPDPAAPRVGDGHRSDDRDDEEESILTHTRPIPVPPELLAARAAESQRRPATVYRRTSADSVPTPPPPPAAPSRALSESIEGSPSSASAPGPTAPAAPTARPLEDRTLARDRTGESPVSAVPVVETPSESARPLPAGPPAPDEVELRTPRAMAGWVLVAAAVAGVAALFWIVIRTTGPSRSGTTMTVSESPAPPPPSSPSSASSASSSFSAASAVPTRPFAESVVAPPPGVAPAVSPAPLAASAPVVSPPLPSPAAPTRARDEESIRDAFDAWIESANARDLSGHMRFYMPKVATFYLARDVSSDFVWKEKARLFEAPGEVRADRPEIQFDPGGDRATVRFRKHYVIGEKKSGERRGEVLQEMRWVRTSRGWRIAGERDAKESSRR